MSFKLFLCLVSFALAAKQPNMIFILADDMGYGDYSKVGGLASTPFIDQLANEGLTFKDAHTTSSVCTPTRYSILTGRYNWRSPLKSGVTWGLSEPIIPPNRTTIAGFLKERGYTTGFVGKWHLGLGWQKLPNGEERKPVNPDFKNSISKKKSNKPLGWDVDYSKMVTGGPLALGFDESFFIPASLDMYPYVYLKNDKPTAIATHTKAFHRPGPAAADFEASNCLMDFAREARSFISNSSKKDKPFFLYLPLTSPHTPIVPSAKWQGKSELGAYGDFLMETDWVVGEVLQQLKESGIDENTMILFTADNGCSPAAKINDLVEKGHYPNAHWRGHKADIFEGGHRVPFIVRWPEQVKANTNTDVLVSTVDFFSTAADIVGSRKDIKDTEAEDSFSFLSVLKGQQKSIRPSLVHHSIAGQFALRQGKWKLNFCPGSGGWSAPRPNVALKDDKLHGIQLYDLSQDAKESNNLQAQYPEVVREMANTMYKIIKQGRSTPGKQQANDGWPNTVNAKTLKLFPELGDQDGEPKFILEAQKK